jgi:hypothetical protein
MPAKIERKILRSGSSKCVSLPPDWLRFFKIGIGDLVDVFYGSVVIIKPKDLKIDTDFLKKEFELLQKLENSQTQGERRQV